MKTNPNQSFDSDDYTPYAGPHYQEQTAGIKSDGRIYEEVWEALSNNQHLNVEGVEIGVENGVVTLKGRVDTRRSKKDAEMSIEDIEGIKDVFNLITLNEFKDIGSEGLIKHQSHLK